MANNVEYYDKYWDREATEIPRGYKEAIKKLNNLVVKHRLGKTLDFGCGSGRLLELLGKDVEGLDISSNAVKDCKDLGFNVRQADFEEPIKFDKKYDTVVSLEVMEHIRDIGNYIKNVNHALKSDGIFLFSVPYHGIIKNIFISLFAFDLHFNNGDHIRFFTNKYLKKFLKDNGFLVKKIYYVGRIPMLAYSVFFVCKKTSDIE